MGLTFLLLLWMHMVVGQSEEISSEDALKQYIDISEEMSKSFAEDEFKTYQRKSYTEAQLQTYLTQHFKRLDLLPLIKGNYYFILRQYLISGNWFRAIGFPEESNASYQAFFDYYTKNEKYLNLKQKDDFIGMRNYAYSIMADNYAKMNQLELAAKVHKQNVSFTDTIPGIFKPSALNNYGLYFYWWKKDLDSAIIYFKEADKITTENFPNHTLIGSIRDNIADVYTDQKRFRNAEPLYLKNFQFFKTAENEVEHRRDIPRLISSGAQLVSTYINLKDLNNAQVYFKQLDSIVKDSESKNILESSSKLEYLETKVNLLRSSGRFEDAFKALEKQKYFSDSIAAVAASADQNWRQELNDITLDRISLNSKLDRLKKENQIKNQRARFWIVTLTFIILIIILLSLFLRRRQHLRNARNEKLLAEQELRNKELEVDRLNSEIISKERDLSDFAINLTENQKWTSEMMKKFEEIRYHKENREELWEDLYSDIKTRNTFDMDSKLFYERLDKLNDSFYGKLSSVFPALTKNETRLCSLIRLKMDSREIAALQNITLASLNTSRYRLRKKMELDDKISLDEFIQQL
ncbi:hypothetical protein SAMN03097699_0983 [Flavobacteriaceae bacterium MAR_2010_188]|nr:hypothetical protein SAMN03097699_0983 [Flavobacteriaceae bacterium MAR_2010_188]